MAEVAEGVHRKMSPEMAIDGLVTIVVVRLVTIDKSDLHEYAMKNCSTVETTREIIGREAMTAPLIGIPEAFLDRLRPTFEVVALLREMDGIEEHQETVGGETMGSTEIVISERVRKGEMREIGEMEGGVGGRGDVVTKDRGRGTSRTTRDLEGELAVYIWIIGNVYSSTAPSSRGCAFWRSGSEQLQRIQCFRKAATK